MADSARAHQGSDGPPRAALWRADGARVCARVLVGGDVLPRLPSVPATEAAWADVARGLAPVLASVDATVVNLECPLTNRREPRPKPSGTPLRADPAAIGLLEALRVKIVSLANNHTHDQGVAGVADTLAVLASRGMTGIGADSQRSAAPPVHVRGLGGAARVGVYAASMDLPERAGWWRPGVETFTVRRARAAAARMEGLGATVRIALLHLGSEGLDHPDPGDVARMREASRAGFDLIAACHSHRLAGREQRGEPGRPRFLFHGLGSLVSTALYGEPEREGLAVVLGLDDRGALVEVVEVPIGLVEDGRPILPGSARERAAKDRLEALSAAIADGSYADAYRRAASLDLWSRHAAHARRLLREQGPAGLARKVGRLRGRHLGLALRGLRRR